MMLVDKHTIELTEKNNASSKGGLISEDFFTLVPSSNEQQVQLFSTFQSKEKSWETVHTAKVYYIEGYRK